MAVVVIFLILVAHRPSAARPLTRHLRSTTFSQRRSDRIKAAAAEDVAAIEQDDEYYRRARRGEPTDSEL